MGSTSRVATRKYKVLLTVYKSPVVSGALLLVGAVLVKKKKKKKKNQAVKTLGG